MDRGTYVGKDGRTYRWVDKGAGYFVEGSCPDGGFDKSYVKPSDIEAAMTALAALQELQEAEEWVELHPRCRIHPDGTCPEWHRLDGIWDDENASATWPVAYREGLEVGAAKCEALRAAARQLASNVLTNSAIHAILVGEVAEEELCAQAARILDLAKG